MPILCGTSVSIHLEMSHVTSNEAPMRELRSILSTMEDVDRLREFGVTSVGRANGYASATTEDR